jgi:hypothetical protein
MEESKINGDGEAWIRNYKSSPYIFGSTPNSEPDFIKDLVKAFRNKLRANRIQKIIRTNKVRVI